MIQTVREKFSCRSCETITQPPAPFHPIARGRAGPNLLATILDAKFGEHQPLNRQSERFAREGIDLSVSTLADWVGACTATLSPLVALIKAHVLAAERMHGDDTTVPVLAKGKTITGRFWTYVRDDRPFGGPAPPAAIFFYSRDRSGEHPSRHLAGYAGILQADAYAGFNELYDPARKPGPITEAACWAHGRRKLFELADRRQGAARDRGGAPDRCDLRRRARHQRPARRPSGTPCDRTRSRRSSATLETWMRGERGKLSRHADVAKAMDYMLKRWEAFTPLPRRRPDLPDQQRRRARAARHRPRAKVMAVRGLRSRRRAGRGDVLADRHRQAQRRRSARLARRRARAHRRSPGLAPARTAALALAAIYSRRPRGLTMAAPSYVSTIAPRRQDARRRRGSAARHRHGHGAGRRCLTVWDIDDVSTVAFTAHGIENLKELLADLER